jgi:hypothetical protein
MPAGALLLLKAIKPIWLSAFVGHCLMRKQIGWKQSQASSIISDGGLVLLWQLPSAVVSATAYSG